MRLKWRHILDTTISFTYRRLRCGYKCAENMTDTADQVIRSRIDQGTEALLERAAAEGLSLSAWMRLHLIRIAEEVLARRRRIAAR
jgi:uncharacterized protein (DUF1778 family)